MELELGEGDDAGAAPGRQQWWRGDGWEDAPPGGWEDGGATEAEEAAWAAVEQQQQQQQQQRQRQRQQQPRARVRVSVKDLRDGTYACRYIPRRAGHYRLTVSSRGRQVGGSPFSVFVSPAEPHAASSTAQGGGSGEGLLLARAGEEARLLLTSHDVHGNRQWHRRLPPGLWRVELQGPTTLAASIAPLPSGRSEARYTPTLAGRYELRSDHSPKPSPSCLILTLSLTLTTHPHPHPHPHPDPNPNPSPTTITLTLTLTPSPNLPLERVAPSGGGTAHDSSTHT